MSKLRLHQFKATPLLSAFLLATSLAPIAHCQQGPKPTTPNRQLVVQRKHKKYLVAVARGPQDVLVSCDDSRICVWRAYGNDLLWTQTEPANSSISAIGVADNATILVASRDGIKALDLWNGRELATLALSTVPRWRWNGTNKLSGLADGVLETVAFDAKKSSLTRTSTPLSTEVRQALQRPSGEQGPAISEERRTAGLYTPDGQMAVVYGGTRAFAIDVKTGKVSATYDASPAHIGSLALSPDGKQVIFSTFEGFKSFNVQTGAKEWESPMDKGYLLPEGAFSPDGTRFCADGLYDARTGEKLTARENEDGDNYWGAWTWSEDGTKIVLSNQSRLQVVKNEIGPPASPKSFKPNLSLNSFPKKPNESEATRLERYNAEIERRRELWKKTRALPYLIEVPIAEAGSVLSPPMVAFSPTGDRVAILASNIDSHAQVWSWPALEPLTPKTLHGSYNSVHEVSDLKWNWAGTHLVAGSDRNFAMFEGREWKPLWEKDVVSESHSFEVAPDGQSFYYFDSFDDSPSVATADKTTALKMPGVEQIAFDAQGVMHVLSARHKSVEDENGEPHNRSSWFAQTMNSADSTQPKVIKEVGLDGEGLSPLAFSPDATLVVSLQHAQKAAIVVHDATTGHVLASAPVFPEMANYDLNSRENRLRFASRSHLFSVVGPKSISVWNGDNLKQVASLPIVGATAASLSPDGKWLLVCAEDAVEVWSLATKTRTEQLYITGVNDDPFGIDWAKIKADGKLTFSAGAASQLRWRQGNELFPMVPEDGVPNKP